MTSIDKQKAETALVRESSRKYEDDLGKRFRVVKEKLKLVSDERDALKAALDTQTAEIKDRVDLVDGARSRMFELENEIKLLVKDVSRMHEYEETIQALSKKIMELEAIVDGEDDKAGCGGGGSSRSRAANLAIHDLADNDGDTANNKVKLLEEENSTLKTTLT